MAQFPVEHFKDMYTFCLPAQVNLLLWELSQFYSHVCGDDGSVELFTSADGGCRGDPAKACSQP